MDSPSQTDSDLLTVLREAMAGGAKAPEAIFRAIADAARVLTGAGGIAIALRTDGAILCRARSGDIAPELGSALNVESGISGECFRTAAVLRCDDTETDTRVEPEVCRLLGIRSIAAIPLRGPGETIGILEAFSSQARAFAEEQISSLKNLGEIAEAAYQQQYRVIDVTPVPPVLTFAGLGIPTVATLAHEQTSLATFAEPPQTRHRYWVPTGAVALLLVAAAIVWWTWRQPPTEHAANQVALTSQASETVQAAAPALAPLKPSAYIASPPDKPHEKNALRNAAKLEPAEDSNARNTSAPVKAAEEQSAAANRITLLASSAASALRSSTSRSLADPPTVVIAATNGGDRLANFASDTSSLPTPDIKISQRVKEGNLIRKVEPVYPQEAFMRRVGGSVTLNASIAEDGAVRDVQIVSGEPVLAAAAVAAVRQWRYSPVLLDGKPVSVQKEITVIFKAP